MNIIDNLKWRYACKSMNGQKVPQEKIDIILQAINLAPTSLGLEAFKVFVIENQELKDQLCEKAYGQQPVKACSHLLVFATRTQISGRYLDSYFELIEKVNNPGKEWCNNLRTKIEQALQMHYSDLEEWLTHQVYIALGFACVAAADQHVDSLPMEGFDREAVNKLLNLTEKGLSSVLFLPLGYRDAENDWKAKSAKVRKSPDRVFIHLK